MCGDNCRRILCQILLMLLSIRQCQSAEGASITSILLLFSFFYCTQVRFCFSAVCYVTFLFLFLCMKYLWNRWTDLRQIHREDMFGPSLGRVWMSRSKIKVTRNKKCTVQSHHPPAATEWNMLAADDVTQQKVGPFRCCLEGWFWGPACGLFGKTSFALVYHCQNNSSPFNSRSSRTTQLSWCQKNICSVTPCLCDYYAMSVINFLHGP